MNENLKAINSYLSFKLGEETFAANVSKVLNILELTKITAVPKAPAYLKGVINLRGTVLPVVDTRIKFGLTPTEATMNTCILVLEVEVEGEHLQVGALVDSVQEVFEIEKNQILPPPNLGNRFRSEFISGMVKLSDELFIMLLEMDKIFSTDDITDISENTSNVDIN